MTCELLPAVQSAEMFRERATEAIDMVQYLQQFSRTVDFRDLSDLFHQTEDLDRAAVRALPAINCCHDTRSQLPQFTRYHGCIHYSCEWGLRAQAMTGRMQALAQELGTARERAGLAANLPPAAAAQQPVRLCALGAFALWPGC